VTAEADTLARLRDCLAHLDDYITRRATELATPIIEIAQADAAGLVRAAEFEAQRQIDLVRELRRRLAPRERLTAEAEDARRRLSAVLGHREPSALLLADLVAEVETRLAEQASPLSALWDPPPGVPQ
jgi:hypothetical protein